MKAQEYLEQLEKIDALIENKKQEKEQWKAVAESSTAGGTSVFVEVNGKTEIHNMERVQSTGNPQKMADAVLRCLEIQAEIDQITNELIDMKLDIIATIERLKTVEYDVLHKLYVQNLTFSDVAECYDKSYSWATTIHGIALKNVQKILDERESETSTEKVKHLLFD